MQLDQIFENMPKNIKNKATRNFKAIVQFDFSDADSRHVIFDGGCKVIPGKHTSPDLTFSSSSESFMDIISGKLHVRNAFLAGKLKISGDMSAAIGLPFLFEDTQKVDS